MDSAQLLTLTEMAFGTITALILRMYSGDVTRTDRCPSRSGQWWLAMQASLCGQVEVRTTASRYVCRRASIKREQRVRHRQCLFKPPLALAYDGGGPPIGLNDTS